MTISQVLAGIGVLLLTYLLFFHISLLLGVWLLGIGVARMCRSPCAAKSSIATIFE